MEMASYFNDATYLRPSFRPLLAHYSDCFFYIYNIDHNNIHRCQRLLSLSAHSPDSLGKHCHFQIVSKTPIHLLPITMPLLLPKRPDQEVEFKVIDGLTLRGSLYPAASKGPAVIMTPGVSVTRLVTLGVVSHIP